MYRLTLYHYRRKNCCDEWKPFETIESPIMMVSHIIFLSVKTILVHTSVQKYKIYILVFGEAPLCLLQGSYTVRHAVIQRVSILN